MSRSAYTSRRLDEIRADRPHTEALRHDFPCSFLVRRLHGQSRAMIAILHGWREPKVWRFAQGVSVIDHSLSDALRAADRIAGRPL